MLCMAICKKCINSCSEDSWDSEDTEFFMKGGIVRESPFVLCPPELRSRNDETLVKLPPPKWCPHKMEHAVAEARQRKKDA